MLDVWQAVTSFPCNASYWLHPSLQPMTNKAWCTGILLPLPLTELRSSKTIQEQTSNFYLYSKTTEEYCHLLFVPRITPFRSTLTLLHIHFGVLSPTLKTVLSEGWKWGAMSNSLRLIYSFQSQSYVNNQRMHPNGIWHPRRISQGFQGDRKPEWVRSSEPRHADHGNK